MIAREPPHRRVRVGGKPRHEFVLGLGSQKDVEREGEPVRFWTRAIRLMREHGLNQASVVALLTIWCAKGRDCPRWLSARNIALAGMQTRWPRSAN